MSSDYYGQLAIDDAHPMTAPKVACNCGESVPSDEIVTCEFCGADGCASCMAYNPDGGYWHCPADTDCGK